MTSSLWRVNGGEDNAKASIGACFCIFVSLQFRINSCSNPKTLKHSSDFGERAKSVSNHSGAIESSEYCRWTMEIRKEQFQKASTRPSISHSRLRERELRALDAAAAVSATHANAVGIRSRVICIANLTARIRERKKSPEGQPASQPFLKPLNRS